MKTHLIVSGIVFVLLIVGLSGCAEVEITNIRDITANPEEYLGKEVTIKGMCNGKGLTFDDNDYSLMYQYRNVITGNYQLTGIINSDVDEVDEVLYKYYYLNVIKVKAL